MKVVDHKKALRLSEVSDLAKVQTVLAKYGDPLNEADLIKIGQDPFLIAAALNHADRCVVTAEVSKPRKQGANQKVPNICDALNIKWLSPVDFINQLDFTTGWEVI